MALRKFLQVGPVKGLMNRVRRRLYCFIVPTLFFSCCYLFVCFVFVFI